MKKLFALLALACAFAIFAEDPKIEVIPVSATTTLSRTTRLSNSKFLDDNGLLGISIEVGCFLRRKGAPLNLSFEMQMAFKSEIKNLKTQEIIIDPIKIDKNETIEFQGNCNIYNSDDIPVAIIFSNDIKLASLKKIEKIKGVAILQNYCPIKIEVKDILSMAGKKFIDKKLQDKGIELKFEDIKKEGIKITIILKEKESINYNFTITKTKNKETSLQTPSGESGKPEEISAEISDSLNSFTYSHIKDSPFSMTVLFQVEDNVISVNKKYLTKESALILKMMIPDREFKVPFCFENIPIQTGVKK